MRRPHPRGKGLLSEGKLFSKVRSQHRNILGLSSGFDHRLYREHGRDPGNVVVPEDAFNLGQIGFVEEPTLAGGLEADATHLYVERVVLRSDEKVGAKA